MVLSVLSGGGIRQSVRRLLLVYLNTPESQSWICFRALEERILLIQRPSSTSVPVRSRNFSSSFKPLPPGGKGYDFLSGKIVGFQKRINNHGGVVPPDGIPDKNRVVGSHFFLGNIFRQSRTGFFSQFLQPALSQRVFPRFLLQCIQPLSGCCGKMTRKNKPPELSHLLPMHRRKGQKGKKAKTSFLSISYKTSCVVINKIQPGL